MFCDGIILKMVIDGDSQVGKSSIMSMYSSQKFRSEYIPTIGVDFKLKSLIFKRIQIKLQIWDVASMVRFRGVVEQILRGKEIVLIVYDITKRKSFDSVLSSLKRSRKVNKVKFNTTAIVGNKADLEESREVGLKEGKELAEREGCMFFEVSAKTGEGLSRMVEKVIQDYMCHLVYETKKFNNLESFDELMEEVMKEDNEDDMVLI